MRSISFKPDEIGTCNCIDWASDTGKSYLVRDLLYYHQDIPIGTVISGKKLVMVSILVTYPNYLYMMNIIVLL